MKEKQYIYVHPDGKHLICTFDKPDKILHAPTLIEAMEISPNYIAYARKGATLVFRDMTIKIKSNPKHHIKDEALSEAMHEAGLLNTAEKAFEEWHRLLEKLNEKERIKFIRMVYSEKFNAGEPIDNIDVLND
ncbi:hypothetical protein [Lysinibacillus endophyticus]|uniref:Uncharacterized protein n=1 Tax=Ureibacillus endophyticus TaxID=1978490 RepID=A0A494ZBK3_9BACL|nr:hypothetical protein [Lysinibacillus endophyticus]MCP1145476.1 hypothetical protein [Lysinibacillus endophyticus]RKQ20132.1 hypothetical protein D8M03_00850 [Lysinibacillus endophyticus]